MSSFRGRGIHSILEILVLSYHRGLGSDVTNEKHNNNNVDSYTDSELEI